MSILKSPYPYFGGKSTVASDVWERLGNVKTYVEPFFGSGAVFLARPGGASGLEIINDFDGNVANFWRAVRSDPAEVAKYCDWPCNHIDLTARLVVLIREYDTMRQQLLNDPDFYNAKIAGYWVWCLSNWIGGRMMDKRKSDVEGKAGITRRPHLTGNEGIMQNNDTLTRLKQLQDRLRGVKVVCGDWMQVMGGDWRTDKGVCGVFLDPPYAADRDKVYAVDSFDVGKDVKTWCLENGNNPLYRIAVCGYDGEYNELTNHGWELFSWKANGGMVSIAKGESRGKENQHKEQIYFSPACVKTELNFDGLL